MNKIFLSHRGRDKLVVRDYRNALEAVGLECWLDEAEMPAGVELERRLRQGFRDSCAAVFFVTSSFEDAGYLQTEINYALRERREKGDGFAIVALALTDDGGRKGTVPDMLRDFVWKEPASPLEGFNEIIKALPIDFKTRARFQPVESFWKPFVSAPTLIVVSRHRDFSEFEPSGFLGFGCAMALNEVETHLRQFSADVSVRYHDRITGDELASNLVLVGGPDANTATREIVSRFHTTIRFGDADAREVAITDSATGQRYVPSRRPNSRELHNDYGVIFRAANPLGVGTSALVLAGSFGFGTWGAAKAAVGREFTNRDDVRGSPALECLVETTVIKDSAHVRSVVLVRTF
jgi:hypothetical protein